LASETFDLGDGHALDAYFAEGVFYFFQFEWLDNRFYFFHRDSIRASVGFWAEETRGARQSQTRCPGPSSGRSGCHLGRISIKDLLQSTAMQNIAMHETVHRINELRSCSANGGRPLTFPDWNASANGLS